MPMIGKAFNYVRRRNSNVTGTLLLMDYNGAPLVAVEAQPLMILPDNLPAMEMMTRPERPVHDRSKKRIKRLLADGSDDEESLGDGIDGAEHDTKRPELQ